MDNATQGLRDHLGQLSPKDKTFASSLLDQLDRRGTLSAKQQHWVGVLSERATTPAPKRETVEIGNFAEIAALFTKAREHIKFPKISINGLKLTMAGDRARVPGSINVIQEGNGDWYGRILQDGRFEKSGRTYPDESVDGILKDFALDPAGAASAHGHLTGNCCFCRRELTDKRSTEVGYGPVCAGNFGLPWGAAT